MLWMEKRSMIFSLNVTGNFVDILYEIKAYLNHDLNLVYVVKPFIT